VVRERERESPAIRKQKRSNVPQVLHNNKKKEGKGGISHLEVASSSLAIE